MNMSEPTGKGPSALAKRLVVMAISLIFLSAAGCSRYYYSDVGEAVHRSQGGPLRLEMINATYRIGANDDLEVDVQADETLNTAVTVRPDGRISLPLVKDVYVEGLTVVEAGERISRLLGQYMRDPETTVTVATSRSLRIYVFGEVSGQQGGFPFSGDVSVVEAIGMAGGITQRASYSVVLIRPVGQKARRFDIDFGAIQDGDATTNIQLQADDIVYVPPTFLAKIGYALDNVLFPFRTLLSAATQVTTVSRLGE